LKAATARRLWKAQPSIKGARGPASFPALLRNTALPHNK